MLLSSQHTDPDVEFHWPEKEPDVPPRPVYLVTKSGKIFDLQVSHFDKQQLRPLALAEIPSGYLQDCQRRELEALGIGAVAS